MNGSKQLIEGAMRMKNLMRPGPMEARAALSRPSVPPPLAQGTLMPATPQPSPPVQLATPMFAPAEPAPRRSVYMDLMKKHDSLNPRIKL